MQSMNHTGYENYSVYGSSEFLLDIEQIEADYMDSGWELNPSDYAVIDDDFDEINEYEQRYRNLWSRVLDQAIEDLDDPEFTNKASIWFNSKNININSFICICHTLDLDPDAERKKIFNKNTIKRKEVPRVWLKTKLKLL